MGQSLIGHLHFTPENNADACKAFDSSFIEEMSPLERNAHALEEKSAMIDKFVQV